MSYYFNNCLHLVLSHTIMVMGRVIDYYLNDVERLSLGLCYDYGFSSG